MRKRQIHIVVGARPNFIKANPVYRALESLNQFELRLINTGQTPRSSSTASDGAGIHHNMSKLFFDELGMKPPNVNLEVGSGTHASPVE